MKATKTELTRLARLAQKDMASGRISRKRNRLLRCSQTTRTLRSSCLTWRWRRPRRSNPTSPWSIRSAFCSANLWRLCASISSSGYRTASELAESVRKRLVAASQTKASDPSTLLFLVQCFGAAKLDLGEELRGVVEHLLEEAGEANADDFDPAELADMFGFIADLVKQAEATSSCSIRSWRRVRKGCRTSTAPSWPQHSCFPARQPPSRLLSGGCWTRRRPFGKP